MSIDSNSQCVRSKYFASKTAMDESLSDFQETKQNCKGPKTIQKTKPKTRKITKRIKGQKDIRTVLKGNKNDLVSYTKEFDTVCKKSGLDIDSEQLQLAIALSKSLQTEVADDASTSQSLSTQGRIAKIRKTLQEYGFTVPENKIRVPNKRFKKKRKEYKLLNTCEEERHQKISSKYSQILFGCLNCTKTSDHNFNQEINTPIYNIATNLEYEYMRNNDIFYVDNLVEKSTTTGSMLRDWSEIPGRPVSPILFESDTMNISEIKCSQDELDVILSGNIKSAKAIFANKKVEYESSHNTDQLPMIEVNAPLKDNNVDSNDHSVLTHEENSMLTIENSPKSLNKELLNNDPEIVVLESNSTLTVREQVRSVSPDIFDDEVSCVMETSKPIVLSQGQKTKVFTEDTNYMDLTECANNVLFQNTEKSKVLSQNITIRRSDDFMEMTECVGTASQGIKEVKEIDLTQTSDDNSIIVRKNFNSIDPKLNYIPESPDNSFQNDDNEIIIAGQLESRDDHQDDIDLTQNSKDEDEMQITIRKNNQETNNIKDVSNNSNEIEMNDLTQHSNEENSRSLILGENRQPQSNNVMNCTGDNTIGIVDNLENSVIQVAHEEDNIDLTQSSNEDKNQSIVIQEKISAKKVESMDLTQSSKSSIDIDDLPEIDVGNTQDSQSNADDTIILNEEEYMGTNGKVKKSILVQDSEIFDLTQANNETEDSNANKNYGKSCSNSFYEEFIHNHSDSKENADNIELCDGNNSAHNTSKESIDLTQSDASEECCISPKPADIDNEPNKSSLGKMDDVSIDYDEICESSNREDMKDSKCSDKDSVLKYDSSKSQVCNDVDNNDLISNSSQTSEVFDLTDNELDYSLHQSRHDIPLDNYNYGGISMFDNDSGIRSFKRSLEQRNSVAPKNNTLEDSHLPEVNIKKTENVDFNSEKQNSCRPKEADTVVPSKVAIVTPKNSEYIIKTDEVTPMQDYAAMTTPQRNRELDKYGLKPFKRKRAIQILTHLYNQTHPIIESYSDEENQLFQPSPSKKPRQDTNQQKISPKKFITSPGKSQPHINSPNKAKRINKKCSSPNKHKGRSKNVNSPRDGSQDSSKENVIGVYEMTSDVPNIRSVDCNPDDWVFQKREKAKVHSCRVPLHIAFHNYVSSRQGLREAILKYEPVNIDVIHKDLVSYGHRYDPKDLLRFLDKKCITVKTTDNNARNKR